MKKRYIILIIGIVLILIIYHNRNIKRQKLDIENYTYEVQTSQKDIEKEYNKSLSNNETIYDFPYIGMEESQVNKTMLGKATKIEKCRDFEKLKPSHKSKIYTWYKNNIVNKNNIVARAKILYWDYKNDKEVPGYVYSIDLYDKER